MAGSEVPKKHPPTRQDLEARAQHTRAEFEARAQEARAQFDATQEKIRARTGRNLLAAIAIGVVLGAMFIASVIFQWPFIIFGAGLVGFAVFELATALRQAGRDVPRVVSTVAGLAVVPTAFFLHVQGLWLGTIAAVLLVTIWRLAEYIIRQSHRTGRREVLLDLGAGALIQVYVTFMAGFYLVLTGSPGGEWWTLASIVIVVSTDIGAYAAGLNFGKHKLAPNISPGKTWEGFIGSIVMAIVVGVLLATLMLHQPWWLGVVMGVLLALVGTAGDLMESLIKRDIGVKDISSWLPGHGGFLDRLDSILPSAAVAYAIFLIAH
ncbi:MAG: phosphatidate cytidylyltransferase [Acidobacteria bacterium]|nr:phosphatidate cytidylyltransferase [Acidobacteriota bacterium]